MTDTATHRPLRFLRTREVCEKIGRSRSSLEKLLVKDPDFPRPIKDGIGRASTNYWYEHEIEAWMSQWAMQLRPADDA
ncbi:AlpA family phage regulatory protein [Cobetia sp. 4B]|uniref:helix-turn-helix transcriptional regulator n=1 Tax=Cobetia sp. 4B TaxID=2758724 RepID=UPI001C051BCD|nr:AlpA family phage regulatory protein [Cobetia sp. 4B]MBR9756283.1 AlpA family phage regulatory protein [Gammaproteobacteria bacterium]MBR9799321.1 AlpA family phage regulatory protein [Gammaproteobacteria bacterium]QWN37854.1 AlpA family phage regulatory protein [Cobetia sp. 4B]